MHTNEKKKLLTNKDYIYSSYFKNEHNYHNSDIEFLPKQELSGAMSELQEGTVGVCSS